MIIQDYSTVFVPKKKKPKLVSQKEEQEIQRKLAQIAKECIELSKIRTKS